MLHFGNTCALLSFSMTDVFFLRSLAMVATTCGGKYGGREGGREGRRVEKVDCWVLYDESSQGDGPGGDE